MRKHGKTDDNQTAIVDALRRVGACVQSLASVGDGCPDLLIAYRGAWFIAEVKNGALSPSRQALTDDEIFWHDRFGSRAPVHVVTSIEDALRMIGAL